MLCKGFTDEEAGATASGRVIARVITRDACEGAVCRGAVCKFSRGSGGLYPSFSEAEKVRLMRIDQIREGGRMKRMKNGADVESADSESCGSWI